MANRIFVFVSLPTGKNGSMVLVCMDGWGKESKMRRKRRENYTECVLDNKILRGKLKRKWKGNVQK